MQEIGAICVAGNHDWAIMGKFDASHFTPDGKQAVFWTKDHLNAEGLTYLSSLSIVEKIEDIIIVHGSLFEPERFRYQNNIAKASDSFNLMDRKVCFVGHTHTPKIWVQQNNEVNNSLELKIEIEEGSKYIVNVGSIGQARDGIPLASVCIYDTDTEIIEIKRVKYDIEVVQKKIIEAGLPEMLAYRLSIGM